MVRSAFDGPRESRPLVEGNGAGHARPVQIKGTGEWKNEKRTKMLKIRCG
jgi:hypothetical protein